jgi:hypothetical protein
VHRCDYDPNANAESWPDAIHDGVELDDAMQLQMFETYVSTNPEIRAYDCHIASVNRHPEHEKVASNLVYGSWRFHRYFDGLKVKPVGVLPILIRPERIYVEADSEIKGHTYTRQRIDVLMGFTSPAGCQEICRALKPGFVSLSPTRVRTHIYSANAEEMCYFFELKYAKTAEKWQLNRRYRVPPLLVVEHNCPYPSE